MMSQGQTLVRIELYNWGNFSGLHTVELYPKGASGPLLAPPPASAILGVNGSGKSTIIDGIMIVLLPFEQVLKLGVTNDYEKGSGGGRRGEDYVLGKFASSDGSTKDLASVYNRQNGVSLFQLTFQHNEKSDSFITVGAVWWYNNYKVSNRHFYTTQSDLSIKDICPNGVLPKNIKVFKDNFLPIGFNPQTFDTAQSYFTILSTLLGGVSKDDLKLFNRAFYVKSIEHIDNFIRENMLIEEENENLGNLLENVSNGNQITQQIELCRKKLESTGKILEALEKLTELQEKIFVEKKQKSFINLFQYWLPICLGHEQLDEMKKKLEDCRLKLPNLNEQKNTLDGIISSLKDKLQNSETARTLEMLEARAGHMDENLQGLRSKKNSFSEAMAKAKVRLPRDASPAQVIAVIQTKVSEFNQHIEDLKTELDQLRRQENASLERSRQLKSDLAHFESHKTLISGPLYDVKINAIRELKLPEEALMFVGETISINASENRVAVESALEPISRNLLVHPDYLDKVTAWIDKTKLNSSVTVKRISHEELLLQATIEDRDKNSILSMVSLRDLKENPFYYYVIRWLNASYAYRLVNVAEFKRGTGLLVTCDGLVKRDKTTMRKLRKDFQYSLGWNPTQRIEELTGELLELNRFWSTQKEKIDELDSSIDKDKELIGILKAYESTEKLDFFDLPNLENRLKELNDQIDQLKEKDKDLASVRKALESKEQEYETTRAEIAGIQAQEKSLTEDSKKIKNQLPLLEQSFHEIRFYREVLEGFETEEDMIQEFSKGRSKLEGNYVELLADIEAKLDNLGRNRVSLVSRATTLMTNYKNEFSDPNLLYVFQDTEKPRILLDAWISHREKLEKSELANLQEKWKEFFNDVLINSIRDTLDELKGQERDIQDNIHSINRVLSLNHFEKLPTEERYLKIDSSPSQHESIKRFKAESASIEKIFSSPELRAKLEEANAEVIDPLKNFVDYLKDNERERKFVTDIRNHFQFKVQSWLRSDTAEDRPVETFTGSRHDAKSSAQTTHLAYTLLASSLAYRFRFNDPIKGRNTPRLIVLDEFGGKFDNEKPRDILQMLSLMGFQPVLVSPMTKAEILADDLCYVTLVHKASASKSKVQSYQIQSKEQYNKMVLELSNAGVVTT